MAVWISSATGIHCGAPTRVRNFKMTIEQINTEMARRYFEWTGPATIAEFQWHSALSGKAAKAAIEPLKLEALDGDRLMAPGDREKFESFKIPKEAQYALVSSIDGISLLRRNLASLVDEADTRQACLYGRKVRRRSRFAQPRDL